MERVDEGVREMSEKVYTYRGVKLTDLSKEDLLKATIWAFNEVERQREWNRTCAEMEDTFSDTLRSFKR